MTPSLSPDCFECAHLRGLGQRGWACEAFEQIPVDILSQRASHRRPYRGDGGLRFERREDPMEAVVVSDGAAGSTAADNIFRRDSVDEVPPTTPAAGVMFVDDANRVLMVRRSDTGEWAFPGGHVEAGEDAAEAAARECEEEVGRRPDRDDLVPWTRRVADGVDFTTFVCRVGEPFEPTLNDEHTEHSWEPMEDWGAESLDHLMADSTSRSDAQFEEGDHPRDAEGKFAKKGAGSTGPITDEPSAAAALEAAGFVKTLGNSWKKGGKRVILSKDGSWQTSWYGSYEKPSDLGAKLAEWQVGFEKKDANEAALKKLGFKNTVGGAWTKGTKKFVLNDDGTWHDAHKGGGGSGALDLAAQAEKPTEKPVQVATKSEASTLTWHMKNYGFEPKKGADAVFVNKSTGDEAWVLPAPLDKGTSGEWQVGDKRGYGAVQLNEFLNHDLGLQPVSTKYIPKSVTIKPSSTAAEVAAALQQQGVDPAKSATVSKAAAIAEPVDPKAATENALKAVGWKQKIDPMAPEGVTDWVNSDDDLLTVKPDGSWGFYSKNGGSLDQWGESAADLTAKKVISMVDQPDAAFEAQHPRGPNGQFIAKLKADFPWVGEIESNGAEGYTKASLGWSKYPDSMLYLNANDESWAITGTSGGLKIGSTTDGSLYEALSKVGGGEAEKPTPPAPKPAVGESIALSDLKKIGPKLGSNEGGTYEDAEGGKYYVKLPKTPDHAKNELLAAALYRLAGGSVLDYRPVDAGEGKLGVASKLVALDVSNVSALSPEQRAEAQKDFAIHAWLANWDAVGVDGANVGAVSGKPVNLDLGGSLLYRAQGAPKGAKFDAAATEWKSLRSSSINPKAAGLFAGMTADQLMESANRLKNFSYSDIEELVEAHGPGDEQAKTALAVKLYERRGAVLKQAEAELKNAAKQPSKAKAAPEEPAAPAKPEKYGKHATTMSEADALRVEVAKMMPPRSPAVQSAITEYKGSGYDYMNDCMRYTGGECDDERVQLLDGYIAKSKLPAMTLYRGIRNDAGIANKIMKTIKVGRPIGDPGFTSCATYEPFSDGWRGGGGLLLEIRVPEGSMGVAVKRANSHDSEYEIMLQREALFRVESWDPSKRRAVVTLDQKLYYHVKQLEKEEAAEAVAA